ncbi:hypothetical protein [Edaphobacter sp. HDX4]|uniref:hypothetical protein n=1 Tax=Edaphobacter sp. HDX4 TaxID=2794064 RepID=UPI003FA5294F
MNLPAVDRLTLQQRISETDHRPIIFLAGYGSIPSTVQAMKACAIAFLPKRFIKEDLLQEINEAFEKDSQSRLTPPNSSNCGYVFLNLPLTREKCCLGDRRISQ